MSSNGSAKRWSEYFLQKSSPPSQLSLTKYSAHNKILVLQYLSEGEWIFNVLILNIFRITFRERNKILISCVAVMMTSLTSSFYSFHISTSSVLVCASFWTGFLSNFYGTMTSFRSPLVLWKISPSHLISTIFKELADHLLKVRKFHFSLTGFMKKCMLQCTRSVKAWTHPF